MLSDITVMGCDVWPALAAVLAEMPVLQVSDGFGKEFGRHSAIPAEALVALHVEQIAQRQDTGLHGSAFPSPEQWC